MADVWPYLPLDDFEETLSWLTVQHRRRTDVSRWALREIPRQTFSLSYAFTTARYIEARDRFEAGALQVWRVPCWREATRLAVASADTVLSVDTDAEYFAGGLAIVWGDCDTYTVVTVDTVGSGSITLTAAVGADYASALVMPLRNTICRAGMETGRSSQNFYQVSMSFEATDNPAISVTPTQLNGLPRLDCSGAVLKPQQGRITRSATYVDSGVGPVAVEPLRDVTERSQGVTLGETGNIYALKGFFHDITGADAPFYVTEEVVRIISSTTTTATVAPLRLTPADWIGQEIEVDNQYRTIASAALSGGNHQLTFSASLGSPPTGALRVVRQVRLATDSITLSHNRRGDWTTSDFPVVTV